MPAGGSSVSARNLIAGLEVLQPPAVRYWVVRGGALSSWGSPWGRARVAVAARLWDADLVHGLHIEMAPVRVPAVVSVPDLIPLDYPESVANPALRVAYRRLLAISLQRAARVIVPSPATEERLVAHGVPADRLTVVPIGVPPRFRPLDPDERERARQTFAGGLRYVVASSGPRPHKNLRGLVAVAGLLEELEELEDVAVVSTGTTPRGGAGAVRFLGRVGEAELAQLYGGAEVMVLPAFSEGYGLPAVEGAACGVPVVCGAGTGALPYIRAGAVEVDVRQPWAMADAIRTLLNDERLRSALGAAGRTAASGLTVDAMARATLAVYLDVLAPASDSTCR